MSDYKNTGSTLAALALVVAVAALFVAWLAYNRTPGPTLEDRARSLDPNDVTESIEDAAVKTENITREGVGEVVRQTGEALEDGGKATQEAGTDIQKDSQAMPR